MSAEGNLYDPAIFSEPPPVGEGSREYWRGKDGKGGYRMDAVMRRYMDILYKYVLEVPVPARKPLFLPMDPPEEPSLKEEVPNESDRDDDGQPPMKKRKTYKKEKTSNPNLLAMQPHLFHLLRPLVKKHHNIRDALAKSRAGDIAAFEAVLQMVEQAVKEGLIEYEATDGKSIEQDLDNDERFSSSNPETPGVPLQGDEEYESSVQTVKECRRPWWICQPYVRPLPAEALQKGSLTLSKKEMAKLSEEERSKIHGTAKAEAMSKTADSDVDVEGTTKKEPAKGGEIEVPANGLVCG